MIIADFSKTLQDYYLYPDSANRMGQFLEQLLADGVLDEIKSARKFASRLTRELQANFQDRHIGLSYAPKLVKAMSSGSANGSVSQEEVERLLAIEVYENFRIPEVRNFSGNIGYMKLDQLLPPEYARGYGEKVAAAFELVADADAVILDLRDNIGGYVEGVQLFLSYFFEPNTVLSHELSRVNGEMVKETKTTIKVSGRQLLKQKIYVLVSGKTASGAEAIAHSIKYSGKGLVLGQQTYGAGYAFNDYPVADKYVAHVPYAAGMHPEAKGNWESIGITPNHKTEPSEALLEAKRMAVNDLLEQEQNKAKDQQYAYRLEALKWERDRLADLAQAFALPAEQLDEYTGTYGSREITAENGALFYHRTNPERPKNRLIPVKPDEFLIEGLDKFRIAFTRDKKSKEVLSLRLYSTNRLFLDKKQALLKREHIK